MKRLMKKINYISKDKRKLLRRRNKPYNKIFRRIYKWQKRVVMIKDFNKLLVEKRFVVVILMI